MRGLFCFLIIYSCCFTLGTSAQTTSESSKRTTSIIDYFKLDRENIYVHLNKGIYLADETMWFKGYITEKKTDMPYLVTSNVYVQILDDSGKIIRSQLVYAENSTFQGHLKLADIASGHYHIRAFTNYMNNFIEDESTVEKFSIINASDNNYSNANNINYDTAEITFYPESGIFLEGITNTVAVVIQDCRGNGIAIKGAQVVDSKGNVVNNFATNVNGYGRFDVVGTKNEQYYAVLTIGGSKVEKPLPMPSLTGVALSVNNYALANKTAIKIKSNSRTTAAFPDEIYKLIIEKGPLSSIADIQLNGMTEAMLSLANEKFSEGINIIIITDKNFNKIAERVVFNPSVLPGKINLAAVRKGKDSITITGSSTLKLGDVSLSVLPEKTIANQLGTSIYSALWFDGYLDSRTGDTGYYLNDFGRGKHYELDNMLMTKRSKYELSSMLKNKPVEKFDFDKGLTIKGAVNSTISDKANYKVQMQAFIFGISELSGLNEKNEFMFQNVFATDSTNLHFSLKNRKAKTEQLKMSSQIVNNKRTFNKPFTTRSCPLGQEKIVEKDTYEFPKLKNVTMLDTIIIKGKKKKTEEQNNRRRRNGMEEPRKISDTDIAAYRDILSYIQGHGYNVSYNNGGVQINNHRQNTFFWSTSPQIFVDDSPVNDFSMLYGMTLDSVDEITINKFGFGGGAGSSNGIIRIYSKLPTEGESKNLVVKSMPMLVLNGFQNMENFANPEYESYLDSGYASYGTIFWAPSVPTDANGSFSFSIPNLNQKSAVVIIEGISSEGQLISQKIVLDLP